MRSRRQRPQAIRVRGALIRPVRRTDSKSAELQAGHNPVDVAETGSAASVRGAATAAGPPIATDTFCIFDVILLSRNKWMPCSRLNHCF